MQNTDQVDNRRLVVQGIEEFDLELMHAVRLGRCCPLKEQVLDGVGNGGIDHRIVASRVRAEGLPDVVDAYNLEIRPGLKDEGNRGGGSQRLGCAITVADRVLARSMDRKSVV